MSVETGPGRREVDPAALVSVEMNRLRGRLAGLVESWGLEERRERAMIATLKSLSYDSERVLKELVASGN
jgi:hypothetical protein